MIKQLLFFLVVGGTLAITVFYYKYVKEAVDETEKQATQEGEEQKQQNA